MKTHRTETPIPHATSKLTPVRLIGCIQQGRHRAQVWDCRCECGKIWAVHRHHLMSGREIMCGPCKAKLKKEKKHAATT